MFEKPLILPIQKIMTENSRVKSFVFDYELDFKPGQFVMCWIPGYDEKPFGIVSQKKGEFMITVAAVGESTNALHRLHEGDLLGIRGPFGSSFTLPSEGPIALVAGGYGMAALFNLAKKAGERNIKPHVFLGARTKKELLYIQILKELDAEIHPSTDDGSEGHKGFDVEVFEKVLGRQISDAGGSKTDSGHPIFTKVFTVGPEIMEMKVAEICYFHHIPFEVSLERYMKCGMGLCGSCCVDPTGWRMCVEGPVVDGEKLKQITEFGHHHRAPSGRIEKYPLIK